MSLEADNPREAVYAELEAIAQAEADKGDGRALRVVRRLIAELRAGLKRLHLDDGA